MELLENVLDEKNEKILSKLDNCIGIGQNKQVLRDIIKYSKVMKKHKCNIEFENYNIVIRNESEYNLYENLINIIAEVYYKNRITLNQGVYYISREELSRFDKFDVNDVEEGIIVFDLKSNRKDLEDFRKQFEKILFMAPTKSYIIIEDSFKEGETNALFSDYATWGMKIERISDEEKSRYIKNFIEKNKLICSEDIIMAIAENPFYKIKNNLVNILVNCKANGEKDVSKIIKSEKQEVEIVEDKGTGLEELDALIGLDEVKKQIKKIINYIKLCSDRENLPMLHMCFNGNPGTGKTTVARIVGKIFSEEKILSDKNVFVEAQRANLIGEYVGQTAPKTEAVIRKAEGGVLFIDEAYSIASYIQDEGGRDYGAECVATLLKEMEDKRDNLCVILAGYTKEMEQMLKVNPGFQSRIQFIINFQDYSADELYKIFVDLCKKEKYKISPVAKKTLIENFEAARKEERFANGRYVRNIFEKIKIEQANRVMENNENINLIKKCDVESALKVMKTKEIQKMKIGFAS